ncbi:phage/plasmid primase, P4 family [Sphingomonas sp. Xoc002]|uniref:phage/plasmid primase, P4 family n=1 Tax=Sphingomonas sp. Xoc002 TaxID=2837624 RepID=UPI003D17B56E
MGQAALTYARRGWAVFPCRERDETVQIAGGGERTFKAKAPYTGKGLKDATRDERRITAWWRQHPNALIGVPLGDNGLFVLDFDPRVDDETGEVFTLERLKYDLEAQMGCPLPRSVTSMTQSDGVHVWLKQPEGEPIRNRGNLPDHVDVRGLGGYVCVAPSVMAETGARYRWLDRGDWRDDSAFAEAPAALVDILRTRGGKPAKLKPAPAGGAAAPRSAVDQALSEDAAVRKYALAALDGELGEVRRAGTGKRNERLFEAALKLSSLVAAGALDGAMARHALEAAARDNPGRDDEGQLQATINSGWSAGSDSPRNLSEIAAASRERANRRSQGRSSHRSAPGPAPAPGGEAEQDRSFHRGREENPNPDMGWEARERVFRLADAWLGRTVERCLPVEHDLKRAAFGIGRRVAAGLLCESLARAALATVYDGMADAVALGSAVDRAIGDGWNRGYSLDQSATGLQCAVFPMTDFGIAERFRARYGADYRYTTAKGWLGWDGRRWRVLDQDEKTPPAEVISAAFDTIRSIQEEARLIRDTGVQEALVTVGKSTFLPEVHVDAAAMDRWVLVGVTWKRHSDLIAAWGRKSETVDKPASVAKLARRWLTVPIEAFDHDAFAVNVQNGTLRFRREERPDGKIKASVELGEHRREDLLTKLSPVVYDPDATCPLYDASLEWAQPDEAMRRYLHQLGGYSLTGDASEQKLWFWWGRGRNGKGVTIESWTHVAGDYADTIPIGSFLDQGIKKRGDAASPDLAKLGGVRMLRASEPGKNETLDSALIKLVTGGEPVAVRMLHRGFFNLVPLFKLIIIGNSKFNIPDTDDGIWGRMKLVSWLRNIEKPEEGVANWPKKDPHLVDKIKKGEGPGLLNRLVAGLLDYLENGLVEPASVTQATEAYRDQSDPLARFLRMCTVAEASSRVQSSQLHEVFVAWAKAAGEREWSNKGFSNALAEKGYQKKASNGMQWLGLKLIKTVDDFVDIHGKVVPLEDRDDDDVPPSVGQPPPGTAPPPPPDDDGDAL